MKHVVEITLWLESRGAARAILWGRWASLGAAGCYAQSLISGRENTVLAHIRNQVTGHSAPGGWGKTCAISGLGVDFCDPVI
jgi:hypothetical protein